MNEQPTISNSGNPPRRPGERPGQAEPDAPVPTAPDTDDSDSEE